jgi:exodeoxyribonuclease VII large subunit
MARVWSSRPAPALVLGVGEREPLGLARVVWGVAALLQAVGDAIQSRLPTCTVEGEISGLSRPASGHLYFSLKDAEGQAALLRCAMFRRSASMLDFPLQDGLRVQVRGRLGLYEPRGELQMVVEAMQRAGAGNLYEQFLRLKARLEALGLFDPSRKRPVPACPAAVGVVTSLGAAALHDIVTTLARRSPHVRVVIYPSLVQGSEAPASLVQALQRAAERREVDLLIVARGGGSIEDLWAFNDEAVVRAVAASPLPVISGVGHETDVTLCDFAADLRAPTPTAAAELAVPATADLQADLDTQARALVRASRRMLERHAQRLDQAGARLARPSALLARQQRGLDALAARLARSTHTLCAVRAGQLDRLAARLVPAGRQASQRAVQRLDLAASRLALLDPRRVLDRGYAWVTRPDGRAIASIRDVRAGEALSAQLRDGRLGLAVTDLVPDAAGQPGARPDPSAAGS